MADNMNAAAAGPPPSGTRPPTRAMTRSTSASTVGLDAGGGASTQVESDLVTRQDMMNLITNLSNEIARIANQGASQAATNPPLSSASSAASRIARKEADRILLNRMPSTADHYDKWRIKAIANMVSASVNPGGAKSFLNMVDGDSIENLDEVPEDHSTFDAKVKAALLSVIETETEFGGRLLAKYQDKPDMSGRSLLRLIDEDFGRRSKDLLAQRASQLVNLKCATYKDLGKFMSQWHTYSGFIAGSSQDISDDTKKVLLREKLKKIEEVKAVLAQNLVNRGTYRELVDALEQFEIMDRVWNHEKERIPVGAAAILQDDFVPCFFCVSLGRDNITHSKEKCWFNPQSPAYKNIKKEPAPRYHGGYKSTRAQSKFKKNDGRNTRMVLSSESKKGLAAKVAQDMELLRLVAQEMASKEKSSEQQDRPKAALALMVKAHHRPTIDSGASHSIRGNGDELGEVTATKMLEIPMQLDCVGGNMEVGTTVNVKNHLLGDIEALNVVNSPPIVSLGQLVKNGYSFM